MVSSRDARWQWAANLIAPTSVARQRARSERCACLHNDETELSGGRTRAATGRRGPTQTGCSTRVGTGCWCEMIARRGPLGAGLGASLRRRRAGGLVIARTAPALCSWRAAPSLIAGRRLIQLELSLARLAPRGDDLETRVCGRIGPRLDCNVSTKTPARPLSAPVSPRRWQIHTTTTRRAIKCARLDKMAPSE